MKAKMKPSLEEILRKNPHLARKGVMKLLKFTRQRRMLERSKARGYGLASPSTQRRASVHSDSNDRVINLSRSGD